MTDSPQPAGRPEPDRLLVDIAEYVTGYEVRSAEALETARYCLLDTLGCGLEALGYPACTKRHVRHQRGPVLPRGELGGPPHQGDGQ